MDALSDDQYKALLPPKAPAEDEEEEQEVHPIGEPEGPLALPEDADDDGLALAPVVPPLAPPEGWVRVAVTSAQHHEPLGVYFDHFTSNRVKQKGYVTCRQHENCVRWRTAFGNTKADYAAYMLAWERMGGFSDRTHMDYEPTADAVALVKSTIQMIEF